MKWWAWLIVTLLLTGVVVGVSVGISLAVKAAPLPTPVPSVTVQPYPTLTIPPYNQEVVLFYDTFAGTNGTPLLFHTPNTPTGAQWESALFLSSASLTLNGSSAAINSVYVNTPGDPAEFEGANITSGKFVN